MLLIRQNYKFESYLQRAKMVAAIGEWCCWYVKITNLKAIYNPALFCYPLLPMLLIRQNYKFESYLQPQWSIAIYAVRCCWYVKITNLKAIYNNFADYNFFERDVVDTSKLQIWKLFTTIWRKFKKEIQMLLIRQNYKFESYLQLSNID